MMTPADRQMAELGVFVHGVLAGLHILSLAYNLRRRHWLDVAVHLAASGYDVYAVTQHLQDVMTGRVQWRIIAL